MIQFYLSESGVYNDSSIADPSQSLVFDLTNQKIRLMEQYDLYFQQLTANFAIDPANSSSYALSQHGAYALYDYVNTQKTNLNSSINAVNTSVNTALTSLINKDTSLNSSINAVNTSVNTYLTSLTNKDTSLNSSINAVNTSVNTKLTTLTNYDTSITQYITNTNSSVNTKFNAVDSSMLQIWQMYYEMQVVWAGSWNQLFALNSSLIRPNSSV